ncbi:MAG: hypothetical protein ABIQ40_03230 [Bacteroidia bacterium]
MKRNKRGYLIGQYCKWNENGRLVIEGNFATTEIVYTTIQDGIGFGQKEGKWKYYDNNGKLLRSEKYKKGKLIDKK